MTNKLKLVLIILFGFIYQSVWAQDAEDETKISKKNVLKLDIIYQAGGYKYRAYPVVGYDRLLWQKGKHKLGISAGFSTHRESFAGYNDPNRGYVVPSVQTRAYFFNVGFYHLYGKNNHYLETGLSYNLTRRLIVNNSWVKGENTPNGYHVGGSGFMDQYTAMLNSEEIKRKIAEKADFLDYAYQYSPYNDHRLSLRMGYRYQQKNGGLFFRGGLSVANFVWASHTPSARLVFMGGGLTSMVYLPYLSVGWSF